MCMALKDLAAVPPPPRCSSVLDHSHWAGVLGRTLPPAASVLFPSGKWGHTLTVRALGYVVAKYARLAGPDFSPHDLRHQCGYRMARHVPLPRLADIMGHDSLDTTWIYVQPA